MAAAEVAATAKVEMEIGNVLTLIAETPILLGEISATVAMNQSRKVLEMVAAVMIVVAEVAEMVAMAAEEIDEVAAEVVFEEIEAVVEVASGAADVAEEAEDLVVDVEVGAGIGAVVETAVLGHINLCR